MCFVSSEVHIRGDTLIDHSYNKINQPHTPCWAGVQAAACGSPRGPWSRASGRGPTARCAAASAASCAWTPARRRARCWHQSRRNQSGSWGSAGTAGTRLRAEGGEPAGSDPRLSSGLLKHSRGHVIGAGEQHLASYFFTPLPSSCFLSSLKLSYQWSHTKANKLIQINK